MYQVKPLPVCGLHNLNVCLEEDRRFLAERASMKTWSPHPDIPLIFNTVSRPREHKMAPSRPGR